MHLASTMNTIYNSNVAQMPQVDLVAKAIRDEIEDFRLKAFKNFDLCIIVSPTDRSAPVFDSIGYHVGYDEYAFDVYGENSKYMRVRINPEGKVRIWYLSQWKSLNSFLRRVKLPVNWNARGGFSQQEAVIQRWEQQARWWLQLEARGKKFRLLDLPAEVREVIYGHVFGPAIEPYPGSKARRLGRSTLTVVKRAPKANLLLTCKLVYKEASRVLFVDTPVIIEHYGIMGKMSANVQLRSQIRQLELALTHDAFLYLFRQETTREDGVVIAGSCSAMALRSMRLNSLYFTFAPPSKTTGSGFFDGTCQKAAVKSIIDLAWQFIRGHPVVLGGYVKTTQKAAIEATISTEKRRFELWQKQRIAAGLGRGELREYDKEIDDKDGGVRLHDSEAVEVGIASMPMKSFRCYCKVRCSLKHWTAED